MRKDYLRVLVLTVAALALTAGFGQAATPRSQGGWLGVFTQTVDKDIAEAFKLSVDYGSVVNKVVADSPADNAGLKVGDVIVGVNGQKIAGSSELVDLINESHEGDKLELKIVRDKAEKTLAVTLEGKPSEGDSEAPNPRRPGRAFFNMDLGGSSSYMGVDLVELSPQLAAYFGVKSDGGALVSEVTKDSPAEKAGIKAGDVILEVGNDDVTASEDVGEYIREKDPGDTVTVRVLRDKKEMNLAVTVGKRDNRDFGYLNQYGPGSNFDMYIPKLKSLHRGDYSDADVDAGEGRFEEEMARLKKEMKQLQKELTEIKRKLE